MEGGWGCAEVGDNPQVCQDEESVSTQDQWRCDGGDVQPPCDGSGFPFLGPVWFFSSVSLSLALSLSPCWNTVPFA